MTIRDSGYLYPVDFFSDRDGPPIKVTWIFEEYYEYLVIRKDGEVVYRLTYIPEKDMIAWNNDTSYFRYKSDEVSKHDTTTVPVD